VTGSETEAAVLVPLHRDADGRRRVVLIERTARGRHGGQIAFPGGHREPVDRTMRDTAVRETVEELGIPESTIEALLELDPVATRTTGIVVTPVVGRLRAVPPIWHPQESEVASVLDVPVDELADPAAAGEEAMTFSGWAQPVTLPVLRLERHLVWGLTLRILQPLLPRILAGEFDGA
jgi:8-oxo-dGTP pyrophosphatase MutT (NUDIX family)